MPKAKRVVLPGYSHHVTQRGNYKQKVFFTGQDYTWYLHLLEKYSQAEQLQVIAYCLMPNHVHLIVIPPNENALARTMQRTHLNYARYFHANRKLQGHLWQNRYHSSVLDNTHFYEAVRYVENNPVRAGLATKAEDWKWSSARLHINRSKSFLSLNDVHDLIPTYDWRDYLYEKSNPDLVKRIQEATYGDRSLVSDVVNRFW